MLIFNSLPHIPTFNNPRERRLWKTLREMEKLLVTSIFSFSPNISYSIKEANHHLRKHLISHLQMLSILSSPKFSRLVKSCSSTISQNWPYLYPKILKYCKITSIIGSFQYNIRQLGTSWRTTMSR